MPTHPTPTEDSADYELLLPSQQPQPTTMGQEEQFLKPEGRKGDDAAKFIALTAAGFLTVITWAGVFMNNPKHFGWFALHPLLQTLSIFFFTYGILTLQPTSQPQTKSAGLARHQAAIMFVGFPSILIGSLAVMYHKELTGKEHGTTWHATFGTIVFLWLLFQVVIGGGSVWFNGAAFGGGKAKAIWKYHRLSGYLLFPILLFTIHLGGGWSNWGNTNVGKAPRILAYNVAPVLIVAAVYVRVRGSKMQF
ncbi:hypothetical protein BDZ94DRAFT_1190991 [Collybia nuda]|uniref:Cytochrome b561 domain-containing protein n=1 Tax=Collybia nuda TaxID=64659 RepID=A0A9P5Y8H8_9AGAR|nr:hypothetical protein BDZ94DRAFT_1190991 [Collybia nuda]